MREDLSSVDKKIIVMFLPPNVTPLVQPMDQNVIQAIKINYQEAFKKIVASEGADISAELKKVNLKDVVIGLSRGWEDVRPELIQKSWTKLLTPLLDDGWTEDDNLPLLQWRDRMELEGIERQINEVTALINQISEDVTRQEALEWAIGHEESWESTNDMDILEHIQNESSSDEEVEVIPGHVKHKEAVRSFETCLKWAEENDESEHHILILSEMKKRAKKAEEANIKQSKITEFFTVS